MWPDFLLHTQICKTYEPTGMLTVAALKI